MTELYDAESLRRSEPISEQAEVSVRPSIPVRLHRGIDSETGRAVSFWIPAEKQTFPELSLAI